MCLGLITGSSCFLKSMPFRKSLYPSRPDINLESQASFSFLLLINHHFWKYDPYLNLHGILVRAQLTFTCLMLAIKTKKKLWNTFKVNNRNTRTTTSTLFWCFYCQHWTYFTHFFSVPIYWLKTSKWKLGDYVQIFWCFLQKCKDVTAQNMKFSVKDFFTNLTKSAGNSGFGHIYWKNPE